MLNLFSNPTNTQQASAVAITATIKDTTNENCNFKAKGKTIKKVKEGNTINKTLQDKSITF